MTIHGYGQDIMGTAARGIGLARCWSKRLHEPTQDRAEYLRAAEVDIRTAFRLAALLAGL